MISNVEIEHKIPEITQVREAGGTPVVFIGICINCIPMVIFLTIVALNVISLTASTPLLHHKCIGSHFSSDHYSNVLHD